MEKQIPEYLKAESFIISMLEEKLSPALLYHHIGHTLDVLKVAMVIAEAEGVSPEEKKLLRIAALFHDAGFIYLYKNHEEEGCNLVRKYLPKFHFDQEQIAAICEMILATRIPQEPKNLAGKILADADLDYLGREDVYPIAQTLYEELRLYNLMTDPDKWIPFQVNFLKKHQYFTNYSKRFREQNKNLYLKSLMAE